MSGTITDELSSGNDIGDIAYRSLADLTAQQIRISLTPLPTVTSLLMEALGQRRGSPSMWYSPIRAALGSDLQSSLGPLLGAQAGSVIPDFLVQQPPSFRPSFDEEVERIAAISAEDVVNDLQVNGLIDSAWSTVARAPRRWLDAYALALRRAWTATRPLWESATPLLEREVARIGSALARGSFDLLVDGMSPKAHVECGRLYLSCDDRPVVIAPGMVLAPIIGGLDANCVSGPDGMVAFFGYPLPGARQLIEPQASGPDDALRALLGEPRSQILRHLEQMTTAGSLAEQMLYVPSAISHHLLALEKAGLVERVRDGRHVVVSRTPRGAALLDLYEP